ncbi:NAD(P)-binding protein [Aaosphaeria arxii CBS 175.79]|uniref:NAD(P)-binding protein n=1 Tax=Aaosphaeria arxii CBS 175.79 TaxID=1450172 RepID=A0A6A5XUU0_9PLEO|nr:NAD(P)-binding protein [Aaosphaeria arxii CBS 175.79]KAF2016014.1 NAD(P)-binding protein [Aaosphaeria arxii CBS 175.79]
MVTNTALIFKKVPESLPVEGEHIVIEHRDFDLDARPPEGGLTVQNFLLSFDPYQRGCLREPDEATYGPSFPINEPLLCGAVSRILKSTIPEFNEGDLVWGLFGAEQYTAVPPVLVPQVRKLDNPLGLDPIVFTGALGTAGLSAYASFYEIGKPKPGQTIYISAASGGVGQIVGQLAKMEGLTVIGSVGSDEKLDLIVNELGFDAGFNYKKESPAAALNRLAPQGLDIYYDNVGGETLSAALNAMKDFGRVVSCGMISQYNLSPEDRYGVKNLGQLFLKRLTVQGFIISDPEIMLKYVMEFSIKMSAYLKEGKVKSIESLTVGIENAAQSFLSMYSGANFGKTVLKIANVA